VDGARLPFDVGLFHYDVAPPDHIDDLETLRDSDRFREANELRAWIEVENGRITGYGQTGKALVGTTWLKVGPGSIPFPGLPLATLKPLPEVTDSSVRFVQTVGGRMALPARELPRLPLH